MEACHLFMLQYVIRYTYIIYDDIFMRPEEIYICMCVRRWLQLTNMAHCLKSRASGTLVVYKVHVDEVLQQRKISNAAIIHILFVSNFKEIQIT